MQYYIDNESFPASITATSEGDAQDICTTGESCGGADLSVLTNSSLYLSSIPRDPSVTDATITGYKVWLNNGQPVILAPLTEVYAGGGGEDTTPPTLESAVVTGSAPLITEKTFSAKYPFWVLGFSLILLLVSTRSHWNARFKRTP